ncbi:paraquat-inducible protein A [Colwelliaceae bacterium 6441]
MTLRAEKNNVIACLQCDALSTLPTILPGQKVQCSCCGSTLFSRKKNPIERTLAVALSGLLLFFPAIYLPIMKVGIAGLYNEASLLDCITLLIKEDFYIIAFVLFMFTIAIPFVRLFSAFYLSYRVKREQISPALLIFFRSYHVLDSWAMNHVFFLGVIISMYKLMSMAELNVGGGLFSLLLLLLCSTIITVTLDQHYLWNMLEEEIASKS